MTEVESMHKKAWQTFFDSHSKRYDENAFTFATDAECHFLAELLPINAYGRVLDIGCGTGRHSIALTKMGYEMTGLDLSDGMLEVARRKATAAGLDIRFLKADATGGYPEEFGVIGRFDACICLCEGSLGLINAGDEVSCYRTQRIEAN
jgi:ubiquinone/menaquinone biosynthesis C-methylase UbiE